MKFGKEFASQMVPEWQAAYMDYACLKILLKQIQHWKQKTTQPDTPPRLPRALTLYRAFSGLIQRQNQRLSSFNGEDTENQPILGNFCTGRKGSGKYETTFLMAAEEGGECEQQFFRRLDNELNKVDKFYKSKVKEVMEEAQTLSKQMKALIAFRIKVDKVAAKFDHIHPSPRMVGMNVFNGEAQSNDSIEDNEKHISLEIEEENSKHMMSSDIASLNILNHVKLNEAIQTHFPTIKQTELNFSKENLKRIEKQQAFIEFYHKLRLLKKYSFMNILAFSKIMKKYDKISSRRASRNYMRIVDNSYLGSSDEVTKLMERVEATFIKHFSNSNHGKGMNKLRLKTKKERHRISFCTGLFVGCTAALILALILIIHARNILDKQGKAQYMENMFPLYSLFAFIVLHMILYAANIFFWRQYRINYTFIFGFKQGTELGYREVLLLSFGLAALALASVISNLDMEMDPKTGDYKALTELLPLILVTLALVILIFPFNILYRSSRLFFLTTLFHCICAPLYKVKFQDFFLADQLTSQVQALRSLQFYICYYGWGDYKHRQNTCKMNDAFNTFYFVVAVVPYWSRLLQCLRRLHEEKDPMQAYNGLKTAYSLNAGTGRRIVAWICLAIAAIYGTYWDLVVDWGLLQRRSKNRWLRDKLLVPYKGVYFGAMVRGKACIKYIAEICMDQTVLNFKVSLHRETLAAIVAGLEIVRRGIWNFFRLKNEHLNNVGKFRAFKSVPLPFNYEDDEDREV
ncbi:hypothetical protein ES319_A01G098200v1 [Gossypium barbadense]|uniref:SPX domain-containing protein n=1 Tax=Gossypium barbadense TaxID=3634 RepID=A0A5J5WUR6_GOSBA|nr:hypothetical protein ES319_A01G098200v1 [Gossypium barbadense]